MRLSFVRAMAYQYTTKFLLDSRWCLGSLQFITDKFGDLTLQEPKLHRIVRSGTGHLPPHPIRVGPINEAQIRHGLSDLGKMDSDPVGDKVDHTMAVLVATTDPIYQTSQESDSEGGGKVNMVGNREELPEKKVEEIRWEVDEEIFCVDHLASEDERGKRDNGLQDDLGASDDEPRDGAPARRHHLKFNSRRPAN
jgi:hypothetical protein